MPFVEQSRLGRAGFRGQSHDDRIAQRGQLPAQTGDKGGVGRGILRKDKLKIHVQTAVALGLQILLHRLHQVILNGHIIEHQAGQLVREAALFRQSGKVHQRRDRKAVSGGDQSGVV